MPKSRVRGVDRIAKRFEGSVSAVELEMAEANRDSVLIIQRHVVAGVPVKTGETKAAFADPTAVGISRKYRGGWVFGLRTKELKKRGYKAPWIEFGTKGYRKGEKRKHKIVTRTETGGRRRKTVGTEVTRDVPARPAHPFFRPGIEAGRAEIRARWAEAMRRAKAKT